MIVTIDFDSNHYIYDHQYGKDYSLRKNVQKNRFHRDKEEKIEVPNHTLIHTLLHHIKQRDAKRLFSLDRYQTRYHRD